jgi:hypothetical protein
MTVEVLQTSTNCAPRAPNSRRINVFRNGRTVRSEQLQSLGAVACAAHAQTIEFAPWNIGGAARI